ncbi:hypothetical protein [Streptomyces sp. NPDC049949]|uniref:hypothetical protein n=1 Tax=Streptomyces sp. NPDC049949 TaxID=3154627 RepID=UPI00342589E9
MAPFSGLSPRAFAKPVTVPQRVGERPRERVAVAVGLPYQPVEGALEVRHDVCAGVEAGRRELDGLGEPLGRGAEPPRGHFVW